jgi:DNA-binding response OmpR family regulator
MILSADDSTEAGQGSTILVVEDDPAMELTLRRALGGQGYRVGSAASGAEARAAIAALRPDLIILDLMLPDADGLLLTTTLRTLTDAPILICSARNTLVDRVIGLKLGAADFVAKPFDLDELEARIQALLRRATRQRHPTTTEIRIGDLVIAPRQARVSITNRALHLTPTEYRLLSILASAPDKTFDRQSLTERVWGYRGESCDHLVDVHMGRLRAKLRSAQSNASYLVTVRGRGFRLSPADDQAQAASQAER